MLTKCVTIFAVVIYYCDYNYFIVNIILYVIKKHRNISNKIYIMSKINGKKVVDCFIFYNELELLNYRLNILYDIIDHFVLIESTHTFVGQPKKLYFEDNKHLFERFNDKIIHIVVEDFPFKYPNINLDEKNQWLNECFQRDCISRGLNKLELSDDDVFTIADLDEIPDPETIIKIKNSDISVYVNKLEMGFYYYNLNVKHKNIWEPCRVVKVKAFNELGFSCDKIRNCDCPSINNGGWHLCYFGDADFIKNKIETFSHQEFNNDNFTDTEKINVRINSNMDLFDRKHEEWIRTPIAENSYLPPFYKTFLRNFVLF